MSINIRLPNITAGTEAGQLMQIKSYLHQLVEQLNWSFSTVESGNGTVATDNTQAISNAVETEDFSAAFYELKALVVKSQDLINSYYERIDNRLKTEYVAKENAANNTLGNVKDIPSGADINSYHTFGAFGILDATTARTIQNLPVAMPGKLIVSPATIPESPEESARIIQKFITANGKYTYTRMCALSGSEWIYAPWQCSGYTDWANLDISDEADSPAEDIGRCESGQCCFRVEDGRHVYISFNCSFAYDEYSFTINFDLIPEQYRPARDVYACCISDNDTIAKVAVRASGEVQVVNVYSLDGQTLTYPHDVDWIDGYIDYWV